jgi:hypothetical protein
MLSEVAVGVVFTQGSTPACDVLFDNLVVRWR